MAIVYRTTGPWGSGKGINLTAGEIDNNFYEVDGRVTTLEGSTPVPAEIQTISLAEDQLTILLDNGASYGPFTLPTLTFNWRGEWTAATTYAALDFFSVAGDGVYLVLEAHTSAGTFDPEADLGSGGPSGSGTYALMLAFTDLFGGGGLGSGSHNDSPFHGGVYLETGASVTPTLDQQGGYFRIGTAGTFDFNLVADATTNFPIGTRFTIRDNTTGSGSGVTVNAPSGVSLDGPLGTTFTTSANGDVIYLVKVAADKWEAWGDI